MSSLALFEQTPCPRRPQHGGMSDQCNYMMCNFFCQNRDIHRMLSTNIIYYLYTKFKTTSCPVAIPLAELRRGQNIFIHFFIYTNKKRDLPSLYFQGFCSGVSLSLLLTVAFTVSYQLFIQIDTDYEFFIMIWPRF